MKITLSAARVNAGLSQTEVGKTIGLTAPKLSLIERGKRGLSAKEFMILCRLYNVKAEDVDLPEFVGIERKR